MHKDYFEAIIQIRPRDVEILSFINNQIKKRGNVFISKIVDKKEGVDLYISDQRFARSIGKKLKESFKGELKTSRKLHSRNMIKSKNIYRVTVCFRKEQGL